MATDTISRLRGILAMAMALLRQAQNFSGAEDAAEADDDRGAF